MSIRPIPQISPRFLATGIAVTALISGLVYGVTLSPTVTGEDSGELIAAAYTLGIPHPPGYPIWCLTAHAAIKLIPFGEIAWRVNLVSALFGVLTACTVTAMVMRLTANLVAGVTGGLSFAFAHEVWEQATIAEVYTQFAFFFALTLYLALRWRDTGQPIKLYGMAFAAGLGVVAHGLMLLPFPMFVAAALWPRSREWPTLRQLSLGTIAFVAPFIILLYLPIRSAADPAMDWGNPEAFAAFWDVLTRAQYESILVGNTRSVSEFFGQVHFFWIEFYAVQPMAIALAGAGMVFYLRRDIGYALIALFLLSSIGAILLTNFPLELPDTWVNTPYWIPAYVVAAVWTGIIVGVFGAYVSNPKLRGALVMGTASFMVGLPLYMNTAEAIDRSDNRYVYEYAENALMTLPTDAIYVGGGDHTLFPLIYMQVVEKQRPDATIVNPYGYFDMQRIDGLNEAFPEETTKILPSEESELAMVSWMVKNSGRPIYSANPIKLEGLRSQRHGILYRLAVSSDRLDDPDSIWDRYVFDPHPMIDDWTSRLIQFDYFSAAAERYFRQGDRAKAEIYLLSASTYASWNNHYGGGDKHAFNNLAILAARGNMPNLAEEFWLRSLAIDPTFDVAIQNLEKARARWNNPPSP